MRESILFRRQSETSRIHVCIDSYRPQAVFGRLYFCGNGQWAPFQGFAHLISIITEMLDRLDFPQQVFQMRKFQNPCSARKSSARKERHLTVLDHEETADKPADYNDMDSAFIIHVKYRQNATWQGEIKWVRRNKTQLFRSSLEMVQLIEEALDEDYGKLPKVKWD